MNETHETPLGQITQRLTAGQWVEPKPQPAPPLAWLAPASLEEIMLALAPCLTIAAPSGMSLDDRTEWFMAAAGFLSEVPAGLLKEAAKAAVCDHPSKIVPTILAYAREHRETWEWRNRPAVNVPRLAVIHNETPASPTIPPILRNLRQADVDMMSDEMRAIALECGAVVQNADGTCSPSDRPA
jgi:hypothetical protein